MRKIWTFYELYNKNQLNGLSLILPFRGFPDIDSLDELIRISKINIKNNYRIYWLGFEYG